MAESTAATTGEEFFRALTRELSAALGIRYCFLTQCLASNPDRLATLAFWQGEDFLDNFEYDLAGTPCELVVAGDVCVYGRDVQSLFPDDQDLVDLEAESYAAVPFSDAAGEVIGHLAILDSQEFRDGDIDISVLKIFAARAGAELERQRATAATAASEQQLWRQQRKLEQRVAERTEELESLIYTIGHDLRSPLLTIGGFAQILDHEYQSVLDSKGRHYLARITNAAKSMGALLDHLLTLNRLRGGELELTPIELREIMPAAIQQVSAEIETSDVSLEVALEQERVLGHATTLTHVFANLISNAVKYSAGDQPRVRVGAHESGANLRAYVEDNGIGIAPEDHQRIFRPFERATDDESHDGTGLGLAIVAKAVERMDGSIGVESTPGQGSTFWIELPTVPLEGQAKTSTAGRPSRG